MICLQINKELLLLQSCLPELLIDMEQRMWTFSSVTIFTMPEDEPKSSETTAMEPIECRVGKWYYKRMGLMFLMLFVMAMWFLLDAAVRYPKKKIIYDQYIEITDGNSQSPRMEEWRTLAKENGWAQEPDEYTDSKIQTQWYFTWLLLGASVAVAVIFVLNKGKVLRADSEAFYTPGGRRVAFADVFRIDRRKWDHKGLAYVFSNKGGSGATQKAAIDDLKFLGADKILTRLLDNFEGELIDRVSDEDEEDDESGAEGEPDTEASEKAAETSEA